MALEDAALAVKAVMPCLATTVKQTNASAKAGALVVADFLISPEAQARKQDPKVWGDPTVLNINALPEADKAAFASLDLGIATLKPEELGKALDEPHPSWMERIETEWKRRYGAAN